MQDGMSGGYNPHRLRTVNPIKALAELDETQLDLGRFYWTESSSDHKVVFGVRVKRRWLWISWGLPEEDGDGFAGWLTETCEFHEVEEDYKMTYVQLRLDLVINYLVIFVGGTNKEFKVGPDGTFQGLREFLFERITDAELLKDIPFKLNNPLTYVHE